MPRELARTRPPTYTRAVVNEVVIVLLPLYLWIPRCEARALNGRLWWARGVGGGAPRAYHSGRASKEDLDKGR